MKRLILMLMMAIAFSVNSDAQGWLGKLKDKAVDAAKNAVERNVERKADKEADNASDKVLNGKKQGKKGKSSKSDNDSDEEVDDTPNAVGQNQKSDFVRGSVILFEDDFANEQMGEFPSKWDLVEGSEVEVVSIKGLKAIKLEESAIKPLMDEEDYFPEEFTLEFDVLSQPAQEGSSWDATLDIIFEQAKEESYRAFDIRTSPETHTLNNPKGDYYGISWGWGSENPNGTKQTGEVKTSTIKPIFKKNDWNHIAFSFNKRAFKVYLNYQRIVNIPNMKQPRSWYMNGSSDSNKGIYITNVVMAKGAVELYERQSTDYSSAVEKAIAETGKFVTNNILFETGKATLKPESMEEIMKVAEYMKKNPTARFEVQGHTDNQGSDAINDPLSQSRAEAVVKALEGQGVDPFNLRPVGKGSHEPVADNGSDEGRAKNRRVEFIKR
jgi:outer membrane protein OmpA-like peptidoglycan-associated protein